MRIGIVSDLHGNIEGLNLALERMGAVDEVFCAGDAFDQHRFSNEVVARLREIGARYILGNHEEVLLGPQGVRAQERAYVDRDLLGWTRSQPRMIRTRADGKTILMFHSTPWAPYGEYLYPHSRELAQLGSLDADFAIYGHTHTRMALELDGTLVINPGSAGVTTDYGNGRRLSYAVLDTGSGEVSFDEFKAAPRGAPPAS
ncbi:MAG: metallophosphoesterase family protein [Myxococcota bacterium]